MAPAAIPLAKLVSLAIKTLSKPVAKQLKHQFVKQPITRNGLILFGQASHAISTRMTIWSSGYKVRSIAKIEDEKALTLGADLISEAFIFGVSGGILVFEYNRSKEKETKKEAERLQKIRDDASRLQAKLNSLDKRLAALEEFAKANRTSILGLSLGNNGEYHEPEPEEIVPINDNDGDEGVGKPGVPKTANTNDSLLVTNSSDDKNKRSWRRWIWPF